MQRHGFSLVELSIVLVILGLLVGGILAGQSLIRASELRSITADIDKYQTATAAFRDKYFALPGDMTNATSFWGAMSSCNSTTAEGIKTCNGNGNGLIEWSSPTVAHGELFLFWQHLSNAGLIENSYNGIRGTGVFAASTTPGINSPRTKRDNGCVSAINFPATYGWTLISSLAGNALSVGALGYTGTDPDYCWAPLLSPEEAWNIDTKSDDGMPGTGQISSWRTVNNPSCPSSNTASATYQLGVSSQQCALVFKLKTN